MKIGALMLLCTMHLFGVEPLSGEFPLWPEGVPGFQTEMRAELMIEGRLMHIKVPTLRVVPPAPGTANGTAVILCPGGGYGSLSLEHEGTRFAEWLAPLGVTSFVLKYRVRDYGHPAPLQDVLRAVRLVRSRAADFGVEADRIGVMGSSAGGHLAATAGTLYDHACGRTGAELDRVSARPDFLLLIYPVVTLSGDAAHPDSREALLGVNPGPELVQLMSPQNQVTSATPPTLLVHSQDDPIVPIENSILFFQALTRAGVSAEFHAFEHGAHGMGMNLGFGTASDWPKRAEEWLRARSLLTPRAP